MRESTLYPASGGVRVIENTTRGQMQIIFPVKPGFAARKALLRAGFRSSADGVWQRPLDQGDSITAVRRIVEQAGQD